MVNRFDPPWDQSLSPPAPTPAVSGAWTASGASSYTVAIIAATQRPSEALLQLVEQEAIAYRIVEGDDLAVRMANPGDVHLVLLDFTEGQGVSSGGRLELSFDSHLPTIAAVSARDLAPYGPWYNADDLIVCPWSPGELTVRTRRLVDRRSQMPLDAPGVIRIGDLVIDTNRYDVFVSVKPVLLTFKEYELLKLLASYPGRVFSREALLGQVWGYEYFGGTRTVDVHVRRLRSKIEDATHTFIDTVWNVGYRFRAS